MKDHLFHIPLTPSLRNPARGSSPGCPQTWGEPSTRMTGCFVSSYFVCDVGSQHLGTPSSQPHHVGDCEYWCVLCSLWFSVLLKMGVWKLTILFEMASVIVVVGGWSCSSRDGWPCRVYLSFSKGHLSLYLSLWPFILGQFWYLLQTENICTQYIMYTCMYCKYI